MNAAELIRAVAAERPLAVQLAEVVSLAVMVDPVLLRRARLALVPEADPGTEADLWASPLVQTRSPDGLLLDPEVAHELRERLAADPTRLDRAWNLTQQLHGHLAPPLRLEEEIAWLSVSNAPGAAQRIEELLQSVLAALVIGERRGLAHWAARALPGLPSKVRNLETARLLDAGARLRLGGDPRPLQEEGMPDAAWITPVDLPRVPVRVRLLEGAMELDASATDGNVIQVPGTDPLLVDLIWKEEGDERAVQVTLRRGEEVTIPVPPETEICLRTILGELYQLRVEGRPAGMLRSWVIDFTAERERHRPFFGREGEQEEIRRLIRESGSSGRLILVHGDTGEGKTALLCHVIDRLAEAERLPPHHFFRSGSRSEDVVIAERSLRAQIAGRFPEMEEAAMRLSLREVLEHLGQRGMPDPEGEPLVLVLDAIDQAQGESLDEALFELLPELLPPGVIVLASAPTIWREQMRLPEPHSFVRLSDPTEALAEFWTSHFPATEKFQSMPRLDEFIQCAEGNWGITRLQQRWISGNFSSRFRSPTFTLQGLWNAIAERTVGRGIMTAALAAARGPLPSSVLNEILVVPSVDLASDLDSPFAEVVKTIGESVYKLTEEVSREFIAKQVDLVSHHRRIAEIATAALEEGSGASEQLLTYAARHAVAHWIAAGDTESAARLAVSARYLILKCRESGIKAVQQELRDCIEAFRSVKPASDEKVDRTTILESTLEILSRGPLPPALDSSLFLSHLFAGLLEQNWEPELARAILQIPLAEPALRPKELVDRPLRRPGDRRHSGAVVGCRFLQRRDTVPAAFSWSRDGTLKLWAPGLGEMIHTFTGHTAEVTGAVLLGPSRLLTSSRDCTLRLWDLLENRLQKTLYGHEGEVLGVLGLSDRRAVSWSVDRTIRVWDVEAGREVQILRGHEGTVTACAAGPEDRYLVSSSADATVRLWDLFSGQLFRVRERHTGPVTSIATSSEHRYIASSSLDRSLKIWSFGQLVYSEEESLRSQDLEGHQLGVLGCTFSSDGRRLVSWSYDQKIVLWDLEFLQATPQPIVTRCATLVGHTGAVLSCVFFPEGDRLVSASADGTLRIWDVETSETLHVLEGHTGPVRAVALDTEYITGLRGRIAEQIVSASDDRTLRVWNAESGEEIAVLDGDNETLHCIALQDRRRVVTWSRMGDLKIYHVDSNEPSSWLGSPGMAVGGALVTPDDRRLILWSRGLFQGRSRIAVRDLERGQDIGSFGGPESHILAGAVTPDGSRLIAGSTDGSLSVWDVADQRSIASIPAHSGPVVDIRVSSDGMWALTASWDGALRILELRKMTSLEVGVEHRDRVFACAIHWDARAALSASADRTLYLWNLDEGQGRRLAGHDDQVTDCAFTRDGTRVVSCSLDGILAIWDVLTGALLHRLQGHADWVNAFVIDDDRGVLYSCSEDRTVRVWDLASGEPRGVVYGVSPFRSLALTYDGVAAGDEAGNFWALEYAERTGFDVFFSHSTEDKSVARALAEELERRGLRVWLVERDWAIGQRRQEEVDHALRNSRNLAVLFGKGNSGRGQEELMALIKSAFETRSPVKRMMAVFLPGADASELTLPGGFRPAVIDLRDGLTGAGLDEIERLVRGVTGEGPHGAA